MSYETTAAIRMIARAIEQVGRSIAHHSDAVILAAKIDANGRAYAADKTMLFRDVLGEQK